MNLDLSLYQHVQRADALGWSVIPLRGGEDTTTGKKPAISWQSYQYRLPSPEELSRWFGEGQYSAYGVVCGEVSGLVVLDCDDAETEKAFREAFPHLTETYAVRSGIRGTTHFYYRTPYAVSSRKLQGADLKAEGSYVVGAGSQIGSHVWIALNDQRPRSLARTELDSIIAFLERPAIQSIEVLPSISTDSVIDTVAHYQRLLDQTDRRNDSLFQTACMLRDRRVPKFEAMAQLVSLHAERQPRLGQRQEREQQRRREAERTIASAYSRPARRPRQSATQPNQLPNSLREALLKQSGGAAFLRTYEGLLLRGCTGGQIIARQEIFARLAGLIGQHSIKRALVQSGPNGRLLVELVVPTTAECSAAADPDLSIGEEKTCLVDRKKPPKSKNLAHRPKKYYRLPTLESLCEAFGCSAKSISDPIVEADLNSATAYRQAMERELIRRQPGQYPQGWLADRLGVTERTIYNYHREIPIHSAPTFIRMQLSVGNYQNWLPTKEVARRAGVDMRGQFLEDERGYRYPPVAALASELLGKGHVVWLLRRTYNYYWVGDDQPKVVLQPVPNPIVNASANRNRQMKASFNHIQIVPEEVAPPQRVIQTLKLSGEHKSSAGQSMLLSNFVTAHLQDDPIRVNVLAKQIYACFRQTSRPLMLRQAQILVAQYACGHIERILLHTVRLMVKKKLKNPVGFFITALKGSAAL